MLASQLPGSPGEELRSQIRLAIEFKVDIEICRQRFEFRQADWAVKKTCETLDRFENRRESVGEMRIRTLQPKNPPEPSP